MVRLIRFPEERCEALMRGALSQAEVDEMGLDSVRAIMSEEGRTHYVNVPGSMLAAQGEGGRIARYTMITESALPPFDNVVLIGGIDLKEFRKRGSPLLFGHGHGAGESSLFPLGSVGDIDQNAAVRGTNAMVGDAHFDAADKWDFALLAWEMVKSGVIRGGSIGFDIAARREPTKDEVKRYRIRSMMSEVVTKADLVEFSVVPLGRDPNAQVTRITNSYGRRVEALCRDGVCSRDAADEFLGLVTGEAVCSRSYHMAPLEGWAAGVEDGGEQDERAKRTEYADGPEGDCGCKGAGEKLDRALSRLDALESRLSRVEGAGEEYEAFAEVAGSVRSLRRELRSLSSRHASLAAETREDASLMRAEMLRMRAAVLKADADEELAAAAPAPKPETQEIGPDEAMSEADFYAVLESQLGAEDHDDITTEG